MAMRAEDGELVRQARAGEAAAFAELVDRYRDGICGVAYHYLGHGDDAQDAAQEAFVRAYLQLPQLRDPGRFAPWLRRITANVCADLLRQRDPMTVPLADEEYGSPDACHATPDSALDRLATAIVVRQ